MLAINAAASLFVVFVDETICKRKASYLSIPYEHRLRAVIDVYIDFHLVWNTRRDVAFGVVQFVEFSGDVEEFGRTSASLPSHILPESRRLPADISFVRYKRDVREEYDNVDSELLAEFWKAWEPVHEAIENEALDIDGWDESGRMFLKGEHRGEEFRIPHFFLSGIGKHL